MYTRVSCTSSDNYLAALERRMFLCDGFYRLSPAVRLASVGDVRHDLVMAVLHDIFSPARRCDRRVSLLAVSEARRCLRLEFCLAVI